MVTEHDVEVLKSKNPLFDDEADKVMHYNVASQLVVTEAEVLTTLHALQKVLNSGNRIDIESGSRQSCSLGGRAWISQFGTCDGKKGVCLSVRLYRINQGGMTANFDFDDDLLFLNKTLLTVCVFGRDCLTLQTKSVFKSFPSATNF